MATKQYQHDDRGARSNFDTDDEDEASSSSSTHDDDDSEEGGDRKAPIMSIFASYYGIEDENVQEMKGTIDDSNFNSEEYVKDLLVNEPMEGLVTKDAEMVHDIRNLDGEMQKLVYDNYNKFITATETIKEMKADVYAMDTDMEIVRNKMRGIVTTSQSLDAAMAQSNAEIDKLIRVQRLLLRLEFLSALPEKLAQMIDQQQYAAAVVLYKKSITVLTKHAHVLSFKKIQENVQRMMQEMTLKVLGLLDAPNLEAVKMTQYVRVLRLLNAPRHQVTAKLLTAHKHRALRLVNHFHQQHQQQQQQLSAAQGKDHYSPAQLQAQQDTLSRLREFHQTIMVGALEACKAVQDLYAHTDKAEDKVVSEPECESEEVHGAYGDLVAMLQQIILHDYQTTLTQVVTQMLGFYATSTQISLASALFWESANSATSPSNHHSSSTNNKANNATKNRPSFSMRDSYSSNGHSDTPEDDEDNEDPDANEEDEVAARQSGHNHHHLHGGTKGTALLTVTERLQQLHDRFVASLQEQRQRNDNQREEKEEEEAVNRFALEDVHTSLCLLLRQVIYDASYLDQTLQTCRDQLLAAHSNHHHQQQHHNRHNNQRKQTTAHTSTGHHARTPKSFTQPLAHSLLHLLTVHQDVLLQVHVAHFVAQIDGEYTHKLYLLRRDITSSVISSTYAQRYERLLQSTALSKEVHRLLEEKAVETFVEGLKLLKPVIDVLEAWSSSSSTIASPDGEEDEEEPSDHHHTGKANAGHATPRTPPLSAEQRLQQLPLHYVALFVEHLTQAIERQLHIAHHLRPRFALLPTSSTSSTSSQRHAGTQSSSHSSSSSIAANQVRQVVLVEEEDVFAGLPWYTLYERTTSKHSPRHLEGQSVSTNQSLQKSHSAVGKVDKVDLKVGKAQQGHQGEHEALHAVAGPLFEGEDEEVRAEKEQLSVLLFAVLLQRFTNQRGTNQLQTVHEEHDHDTHENDEPFSSPFLRQLTAELTRVDYFPGTFLSPHFRGRLVRHAHALQRLLLHMHLQRLAQESESRVVRGVWQVYQEASSHPDRTNHKDFTTKSRAKGSHHSTTGEAEEEVESIIPSTLVQYAQWLDHTALCMYLALGETPPAAPLDLTPSHNTSYHTSDTMNSNTLSSANAMGSQGGISGGAFQPQQRRGSLLLAQSSLSSTMTTTGPGAGPQRGAQGHRASIYGGAGGGGGGGGGGLGVSTHGALSASLQMDLDRLFAQTVHVYPTHLHIDHTLSNTGGTAGGSGEALSVAQLLSVEGLLGVSLKAAIKGSQESARLLTLSPRGYAALQAVVAWIKALSAALLTPYAQQSHQSGSYGRTGSYGTSSTATSSATGVDKEVDQLLLQWQSTLFLRFNAANDIATATLDTTEEVQRVQRGLTQAMQKLKDRGIVSTSFTSATKPKPKTYKQVTAGSDQDGSKDVDVYHAVLVVRHFVN